MKNELWKDIKNYEGLYQVSNLGRVKSVKRDVVSKKGQIMRIEEKIKTLSNNGKGYLVATLYKNGKSDRLYVHRLVCDAFIPNVNNHPCVNHKDENRQNNNVENLEWCTYSYNNTYNDIRKRILQTYNKNAKNKKKVFQFTLDGEFIKEYSGCRVAERTTGLKSIHHCLSGRYKQSGGYLWSYSKIL